jgi:hypothetical protein
MKSNRNKSLYYGRLASIILAIGAIVLIIWRMGQLSASPNLIANPSFEVNGLESWKVANQGAGQAMLHQAEDSGGMVAQLDIPATKEGSWVGIGQEVIVDPGQTYSLTVNFRLSAGHAGFLADVILRILQFDQNGDIVHRDQITDPRFLVAHYDEQGRRKWDIAAHRFTTHDQAARVEVGIGLFGRGPARIDIDDFVVRAENSEMQFGALARDPVILPISLIFIFSLGFVFNQSIVSGGTLVGQIARNHRVQRIFVIIGVNIILFLIFAEIFALAFYFWRDGSLYYANPHRNKYELIGNGDVENEFTHYRIHPTLGYTLKPGTSYPVEGDDSNRANNYGFISEYDYPFAKAHDNVFIIGVFGGSVATEFVINGGADRLVDIFKQNKQFKDKGIVVLNFANLGYKQPQQLQILTYFLSLGQEIDLVINIDGFNEITHTSLNNDAYNIAPALPSGQVLAQLSGLVDYTSLTPEKLEMLSKINLHKSKFNNLVEMLNNNSNLASVNFVEEQFYQLIKSRYEAEVFAFQANSSNSSATSPSLIYLNPSREMEELELFNQSAELWVNASILMNQLSVANKMVYFHFIQPNQYFSNKTFSQEEAKIAINPSSPYYRFVRNGYPVLVERFDELKQNGVNFYSAIEVFDNVTENVYADDCCHVNRLGNEIMADFIANNILSTLE